MHNPVIHFLESVAAEGDEKQSRNENDMFLEIVHLAEMRLVCKVQQHVVYRVDCRTEELCSENVVPGEFTHLLR